MGDVSMLKAQMERYYEWASQLQTEHRNLKREIDNQNQRIRFLEDIIESKYGFGFTSRKPDLYINGTMRTSCP